MFDHISLKVRDFPRSLAFYQEALAPLGFEAQYLDEQGKSVGFGPKGGAVALWIAEGTSASSAHMALVSANRKGVGGFHAAFLIDPDGNNIEAVTHGS